MTTTEQFCPICAARVRPQARYPRYVCAVCASLARTIDGRPLVFFNLDLAGGLVARYVDSGEVYDGAVCYIDGVRCVAAEARFGGVVIEPALP